MGPTLLRSLGNDQALRNNDVRSRPIVMADDADKFLDMRQNPAWVAGGRASQINGGLRGTARGIGQVREVLDNLTGGASFEGCASRPTMASYS